MKRTKKIVITTVLVFFFGIFCSHVSFADTAGGSVSTKSDITFFKTDEGTVKPVDKKTTKKASTSPVKKYLPQTGETHSLILVTLGTLILMLLIIGLRRRGENDKKS